VAPNGAFAAENEQLLATPERPAVVVARKSAQPEDGRRGIQPEGIRRSPRVVVSVTRFQPARSGEPVQVVVKARDASGTEREVGRFGLTPNIPFKAADPSRAQRFGLRLPVGVSNDQPLQLNVYLEAADGGAGAQLEVGGAELR
jgi:hypothetical protein